MTAITDLKFPKVAITGGAGYVGSALVPTLLDLGYEVTVLDLFWYGENVFGEWLAHPRLHLIKGDIRDPAALNRAFQGQDAVIHLACISNDPSFELNPKLGKSINYDSFAAILACLKACAVKRFIYASSSSVYGVKEIADVTEEVTCEPLTDYSKFKLLCEEELKRFPIGETEWTILRPATVCGYAPRLRLDLTVNILTISALARSKITVHGGSQLRPNLNIKDMVRAYVKFLAAPKHLVHEKTFNIGFENRSVGEIARTVARVIANPNVQVVTDSTTDLRSYHVNSDRVERDLGFKPEATLAEAVRSLVDAFEAGRIPLALDNPNYYNIRRMKELLPAEAGI